MNIINNAQKAKIHVLKTLLRLDDDHYRSMLFEGYRVRSCVHLNMVDAADLIRKMEAWAYSAGVQRNRAKYDQCNGRDDDMATAAQLRKIDVLWRQVSRQTTAKDRGAALNKMIKRITGIDDIRWIEKRHVGKILNTINAMLNQKKKEDERATRDNGPDRTGGKVIFGCISGSGGSRAEPRIGSSGYQEPAYAGHQVSHGIGS
ncbi:MAG: regulatory protein GemA [Chitinispirillaceae bacterium]|nr:regulatory protein GemA [Chitinispirillaceae bacterium]